MRKLTLLLATVATGLALACVYLLDQLDVERARTRTETIHRQELEARVQQIEREQLTVAREASDVDAVRAGSAREEAITGPAISQPDAAPDHAAAGWTPPAHDPSLRLRAMRQNAADREVLRAQEIATFRASNPDIATELGLTAEEYERLLEVLAEQNLQRMDLIDGGDFAYADGMGGLEELVSNQKLEVANLLGAERAQQLDEYLASQPVRTQVRRLRARLREDNALRDDQSARLVAALRDEAVRFSNEQSEQYEGENIRYSMGSWYGAHFVASETRGSTEEQILAQMEDYNGRTMSIAASVLTDSQLEVFTQLMDEDLALQRVQLRMDAAD